MKIKTKLFVFALAGLGSLYACGGGEDSRREDPDNERMGPPTMHQDTAWSDPGMTTDTSMMTNPGTGDTSARDPRTEPRPQ